MHFFNSGVFWFLEGIFACLAVIGFKIWMEDHDIAMPFWKWLLCAGWMLFFGFTIAFVGTSAGENEMNAAVVGGIIFGLILIITAAALWRLLRVATKSRKSKNLDEKL